MITIATFAACGDDDDRSADSTSGTTRAAATLATSPAATPVPTATPTPNIGSFDFESARAMEHLRVLTVDIGSRPAGTDAELRAAEYIRDELAAYGYAAELQPFEVETYQELNAAFEVIAPDAQPLQARALSGSISGTAEGNMVFAGFGRIGDITGVDGKIALVERGEISFEEKVVNVSAAGAIAAVMFNSENGAFGGVVYNLPEIPVVTISREDGLALLDTLATTGVTGRVAVDGGVVVSDSHNVVARMPDQACRLVIGGHLDSVVFGPGANDNGSGTATVIELARVLASRDETDGLCFALFGSEEIGLVGSKRYVDSMPEAARADLIGMLNFDMFGLGDDWPLVGSSEIVEVAGEAAEALGIPYRLSSEPAGVGSDHANFIEAGIPAMLFNCFCDANYHTAADRFEFVKPERLEEAGGIGLGMVERLLSN